MPTTSSRRAPTKTASKRGNRKGRARKAPARRTGKARRGGRRGAAGGAGARTAGRLRRGVSSVRGRRWSGILEDLFQDHQKVRGLLAQLVAPGEGAGLRSVFDECDRGLMAHSRVEEEVFYPAFKEALAGDEEARELYFGSVEEHHAVERLLVEMRTSDPGGDRFRAQCRLLKELVERHAEEEERSMFPQAAKSIPAERLEELGRMARRRKQEMVGPAEAYHGAS